MALSLARITDFFGLSDDEELYDEPVNQPQAPVMNQKPVVNETPQPVENRRVEPTKPVEQAMANKERVSPVTSQTRNNQSRINRPAAVQRPVEKVVAMPTTNQTAAIRRREESNPKNRISVVEPRAYSEAITIAKRISGGETVLINFQSLDEARARRVVDFLTGAVFMIDGDIKRVGNEMFLCTPQNVEIENSSLSSIANDDIFGLEM